MPFGLYACSALVGSPWLAPAQIFSIRNNLKRLVSMGTRGVRVYIVFYIRVSVFLNLNGILFSSVHCYRIYGMALYARARVADDDAEFHNLLCPSDRFLDLLTRCVQEPVLAQSLGSYTRLSLRERERWLSEFVDETLHVDPARTAAARVYCSSPDFEVGVAMHVL